MKRLFERDNKTIRKITLPNKAPFLTLWDELTFSLKENLENNLWEINAHRMCFNDNLTADAIDNEQNWFIKNIHWVYLIYICLIVFPHLCEK